MNLQMYQVTLGDDNKNDGSSVAIYLQILLAISTFPRENKYFHDTEKHYWSLSLIVLRYFSKLR